MKHPYWFVAAALAAFFVSSPAVAQWQTPDHSVPIGRGSGATGFKNTTPSAAGQVLGSNGASADPLFQSGSSWFDAAYCNTVGYLIVRTIGAWTCSKSVSANPVWWGADPTGGTDSTAAINAALTATPFIQFPPGKFTLLSPLVYTLAGNTSVHIQGSGAETTILQWPTGDGIHITYNNNLQGAFIADLSIVTGAAGTGDGINLVHTTCLLGGTLVQNVIRNVLLRGDDYNAHYWANGVDVVRKVFPMSITTPLMSSVERPLPVLASRSVAMCLSAAPQTAMPSGTTSASPHFLTSISG